jgi:hypothetical protein
MIPQWLLRIVTWFSSPTYRYILHSMSIVLWNTPSLSFKQGKKIGHKERLSGTFTRVRLCRGAFSGTFTRVRCSLEHSRELACVVEELSGMFTRFLAGDFLRIGQSIVPAKLYKSRISSPSLSQKFLLYPALNSNFPLLLSVSSSCLNQHSFCCSEREKKRQRKLFIEWRRHPISDFSFPYTSFN